MRSFFHLFSLGLFSVLCLSLLAGCGDDLGSVTVNPNFPSLGDTAIEPTASVSLNNQGQIIELAPSFADDSSAMMTELSGAVGSISDQNPEHYLCVLIDGEGGNADLEVCNADAANRETPAADLVCPDQDEDSYCHSENTDSEPDYCTVTGARDYVFSLINRSDSEVLVAYQVIDVTLLPTQSCEDLKITENSIAADTQ